MVLNYSYVLDGLQMKLQLLPPSSQHTPGACNVGLGSWECPGWHAMLGCSWTYRTVNERHQLLAPLIPFGVPTLHILPLHLCCSSTSSPKPFFPSFHCGSLQGIPGQLLTNAKGPLFLGSSRGEQHTGSAHKPWQSKGGDLEHCLDII